jgi:hypothetical protein
MNRYALRQWILLALAIALWAALIYAFLWIGKEKNKQTIAVASAVQSAQNEASASKLHSLMHDTEAQRAKLTALTDLDIGPVVDKIEAAGLSAGVTTKLQSAQQIGGAEGSNLLKTVEFRVASEGKFDQIMHALRLFETLPIPSSVDLVDIVHSNTDAGAGTWHLNATIRVLTSADLSQ